MTGFTTGGLFRAQNQCFIRTVNAFRIAVHADFFIYRLNAGDADWQKSVSFYRHSESSFRPLSCEKKRAAILAETSAEENVSATRIHINVFSFQDATVREA